MTLRERPVTPEEASHPRGALVAVVEAAGIPSAQHDAALRSIAAAAGVRDPGSRSCQWARDLAAEVLRRGGRRGTPTAANVCEAGQGFALIQAGNVWPLPTAAAPAPSPSRWPWWLLAAAAAVTVWKVTK